MESPLAAVVTRRSLYVLQYTQRAQDGEHCLSRAGLGLQVVCSLFHLLLCDFGGVLLGALFDQSVEIEEVLIFPLEVV